MTNDRLARRFVMLGLLAYPSEYRSEYGAEMKDVLIDSGRVSRAPSLLAEVASFAGHGLAVRLRGSHPSPSWVDARAATVVGLCAVLFGVAANAGTQLALDVYWTAAGSPGPVWIDPLWGAYVAWVIACVALVRGATLIAKSAAWFSALGAAIATLAAHFSAMPGADSIAGARLPYVVASVVLATLIGRTSAAKGAHALALRTRVPLLISSVWACHFVFSMTLHQPISAAWASVASAASVLAAYLLWGTLLRASVLLGMSLLALPLARVIELLDSAASRSGAVFAVLLLTAAALVLIRQARRVRSVRFTWAASPRLHQLVAHALDHREAVPLPSAMRLSETNG